MDGLPYTIHGISMKWRQYRWCQNIALCYDVLREMKPSSHVPLYEDETVGDCVLIKLQSYFSMAPSDCVWLWTQWLFIAAIEFELFFSSSLHHSFVLFCSFIGSFTIWNNTRLQWFYAIQLLLNWYYPKARMYCIHTKSDLILDALCNTVNISHCKWNYIFIFRCRGK